MRPGDYDVLDRLHRKLCEQLRQLVQLKHMAEANELERACSALGRALNVLRNHPEIPESREVRS